MIPAQPDREAAKATGTYDVTAKDPEKRIALALARRDPGGPIAAIAGQHRGIDKGGKNRAQYLVNAGTWQQSPTSGTKTGPLAQRLEQGTHNPLVVGSNPTGPNSDGECQEVTKACVYKGFHAIFRTSAASPVLTGSASCGLLSRARFV